MRLLVVFAFQLVHYQSFFLGLNLCVGHAEGSV